MSRVVTGPGYHQQRSTNKPSLNVSKGDDSFYQQKDEWSDSEGSVGDDSLSEDLEEEVDCPLCLEDMDESDQHFFPCPCQYQICRFCWHKIREEGNEKCPACRRTYTDEDVVFTPVVSTPTKDKKAVAKSKQQQKRKVAGGKKEETLPSRKVLSEYRVIQRNLVYVIGISARIAHENILKEPEYFGQYGKIVKIVVNRRNLASSGTIETTGNGGATSATTTGPSASAYITFVRKEDAARCIATVDGSVFDGRVLRATYGTTKYCSYFLRGMTCTNAGCMYLHEEGEHIDSFTKDELTAGKMHLHSYVLDKNEAAAMKQFGVLLKPVQPVQPAQPQPAVVRPAPISKPSTPVSQQIPPPFLDRTPSSFYERLSQLAARHEDDLFEGESKPTSPPPVILPPSRRAPFRFDPFTTADITSPPMDSPGKGRPPPPPPIGSPVGRSGSAKFPPGMAPRQPLFSESVHTGELSSPVASRAAPAWSTASTAAQQKLEPSVEQFFNLFSNGALSTTTNNMACSEPQVAPQSSQTEPMQASEEPSPFLFDPKGKSIFDDPAIMQARQVNKPKPLPASVPTSPKQAAPPQMLPQSGSGEFTTVSQSQKKASNVQPSSKKAKAKTSPPMVIQEPVFTNQYEALLLDQAPATTAKSMPVTPSVKKTKKVSPTLAAIDPAVISCSSTHPTSNTAPYQRVTILPRARKTDASLISVDISSLGLEQLNEHIGKLEAALHASHEDSRQIEAFMRDILRKSMPTSSKT